MSRDATVDLSPPPLTAKSTYDWSQFRKKVEIQKARQEVLSYWTRSENLTKWFLAKASYFDARMKEIPEACEGATFRWEWKDCESTEGKILQLSDDTFSFTFGSPSEIHGVGLPPVKVTLNFEVLSPNRTRLHLHQFDMPTGPAAMAAWHVSCSEGWTHFLMNLKSVIQYGHNLEE